jgi:hypothetical protein
VDKGAVNAPQWSSIASVAQQHIGGIECSVKKDARMRVVLAHAQRQHVLQALVLLGVGAQVGQDGKVTDTASTTRCRA